MEKFQKEKLFKEIQEKFKDSDLLKNCHEIEFSDILDSIIIDVKESASLLDLENMYQMIYLILSDECIYTVSIQSVHLQIIIK